MMGRPREVCHLITGLQLGGAETMLWNLLAAMPRERWRPRVLSLRDGGVLGPRIEALGVPVSTLGLGHFGVDALTAPVRLRRALRTPELDLVQGWMYHGNIAALLGSLGRGIPVVWNVRQSFGGFAKEKVPTALIIRASAWLSARAARVIYNSQTSRRQHEAIGFAPHRAEVIPNGFDLDRFRPRSDARSALRRRLGAPQDTVIIGQVARFHPMKNQAGFLRAAVQLAAQRPAVLFVLAGAGVDYRNTVLCTQIKNLGLGGRVHLLGEEKDVPGLMAGLDLLCSPSGWGEGFPNVLGEAMACGVPCVATDVGDAAWIVGDAGVAVPPDDEPALVRALGELLDAPPEARLELGLRGRKRVEAEFALPAVARRYELLYDMVISERVQR